MMLTLASESGAAKYHGIVSLSHSAWHQHQSAVNKYNHPGHMAKRRSFPGPIIGRLSSFHRVDPAARLEPEEFTTSWRVGQWMSFVPFSKDYTGLRDYQSRNS
jgi:hypothetical protein